MLPITCQQEIISLSSSDCVLKTLVFILILSLSPYQDMFFLSLRQFCLSIFFGDYSFFLCLLKSLLIPNRKKLGTPTLLIFVCLLVQSCSSSFINTHQEIRLSQLWSPLRWLNSTKQQLVNDFTKKKKKNHICFLLVGESHKNNPTIGIFSKQTSGGKNSTDCLKEQSKIPFDW